MFTVSWNVLKLKLVRARIYFCYHSIIQTIIQILCTLKITISKIVVLNIFHKTILRSNTYAKLTFIHVLTCCDTTFSINWVGKATVFKILFLNKKLQEAFLVITASSKLHEEIESACKKAMFIQHSFFEFTALKITYLESIYSKILRQTGYNTCSRIRFKVP